MGGNQSSSNRNDTHTMGGSQSSSNRNDIFVTEANRHNNIAYQSDNTKLSVEPCIKHMLVKEPSYSNRPTFNNFNNFNNNFGKPPRFF